LNAARSALLEAKDPENNSVRIIAHGKHNLSEAGESRRFRIEGTMVESADGDVVSTSRIAWLGSSSHTVADLLRSDHRRDPATKRASSPWSGWSLVVGCVAGLYKVQR
jgi:hypothetical protein